METVEKILTRFNEEEVANFQRSNVYNFNLNELEIDKLPVWVFSDNFLDSMESLPHNSKLQCLCLNNNVIEEIFKDTIELYKQLKYFFLDGNHITKIQNIESLKDLIYLDLSKNRISVLENIEDCTSLRHLSLANNRIHSIFLLSSIHSLHFLDLRHNQIDTFDHFDMFTSITHLYLDECFISTLEGLSNIKTLKHLSLSHNLILSDKIIDLPNLISLDISDNKINSLYFLARLHSLQWLNVSGNIIDDDGFVIKDCVFENLTYIDVSRTRLTNPFLISQLAPNFQKVDFAATYIDNVDFIIEFLSNTNNLLSLDLRDTLITQGLYFDHESYNSLEEYDRKYPDNKENRLKYRLMILSRCNLNNLDGIATDLEQDYAKNVKSPIKRESSSLRIKNAEDDMEKLTRLYAEYNDLRMQLGKPPRSPISRGISSEEKKRLIEYFTSQNAMLAEEIELKLRIERLKNENMQLHKQLNHENHDEFDERDLEKLVQLYESANQQLRSQLQPGVMTYQKKKRSRLYVYEKTTKLIFKYARTSTLTQKKLLSNDLTEFKVIESWIASKVIPKIKLVHAVQNSSTNLFINRDNITKWLTLVVSCCSNAQDIFDSGINGHVVVSDHMNHVIDDLDQYGYSVFMICAFDSGNMVVDYQIREATPPIPEDKVCDSILYNENGNQNILVINHERIVPIYLVQIQLEK